MFRLFLLVVMTFTFFNSSLAAEEVVEKVIEETKEENSLKVENINEDTQALDPIEDDKEKLEIQKKNELITFVDDIISDDLKKEYSIYKPNYLLVGGDDLKLQLSVKYRIFKGIPLFFAYTQQMFWDIYKESKPFRDINFSPQLFHRFLFNSSKRVVSIDFGYKHKSNGKDGLDSRSYDQIFSRAHLKFPRLDDFLYLFVELYYSSNEDSTNEDINDFIGYTKFTVGLGRILKREKMENLDIFMTYIPGNFFKHFNRGAIELNIKYTVPFLSLNPDLHFQVFEGYGEDLREYNVSHTRYRLGFSFNL